MAIGQSGQSERPVPSHVETVPHCGLDSVSTQWSSCTANRAIGPSQKHAKCNSVHMQKVLKFYITYIK
ncbi:hypothetical protein DPMN_005654 [Dreissena polymorpha]|uniref:Uncharacterized protein n=1 Tax=Dreissena polymorpha TaxID=45954 RepID=A0A9D4MV35_DREPO|nr:hypothetical protein DPMN_005654 [Dreissena polymorpha]